MPEKENITQNKKNSTETERYIAAANIYIMKMVWKLKVGNFKDLKHEKDFYKTLCASTNDIGNISKALAVLSPAKAKKVEESTGLKREIFQGKQLMTLSTDNNENLDKKKIRYYFGKNSQISDEANKIVQKAINNIEIDIPNETDLYKWCYYIKYGQGFTGYDNEENGELSEKDKQRKTDDIMKRLKTLCKHNWLCFDKSILEEYKIILEYQLHMVEVILELKKFK